MGFSEIASSYRGGRKTNLGTLGTLKKVRRFERCGCFGALLADALHLLCTEELRAQVHCASPADASPAQPRERAER